MSKRITSAVVAGIVTLGMSVPAVGFASSGGTPHSTKPCRTLKSKGHRGKSKSTRGKHCGRRTS